MKTISNYSKRLGFSAFTLVLVLLASCSSSEPPLNEVYIKSMAFTPATLTVAAGTTVKWTNKDAVTHTVTEDSGLFDSGNISSNGVFSHTFATAGTFNYHCALHSSMKAKIIVTAQSSNTSAY